ncbi:conserved hypothetical protein, partial [Ricinus communis]
MIGQRHRFRHVRPRPLAVAIIACAEQHTERAGQHRQQATEQVVRGRRPGQLLRDQHRQHAPHRPPRQALRPMRGGGARRGAARQVQALHQQPCRRVGMIGKHGVARHTLAGGQHLVHRPHQ